MKIFITGASGFIGKHLIKRLLNEGHDITINLRKPIADLPDSVKIFKANENEINTTIDFFKKEKFDGIIHLASLYITTHKPEDIFELINSNVRFSTFMLEAAAQAQIPWFINTGTFWQHYENKDYSPVNLYAATKQAFESIAQYYIETNKIKLVSLHLSDTYGPNDTRPKIFNLWERIAKTGETLEMSAGEQLIDISHIDDIVSAFALLATHLQTRNADIKNGDVFAVKAKERYTLKQLAAIYEDATNTKLNINWGAREYREREVMQPWAYGVEVPGWVPKLEIEIGLKTLNN